MFRAAEACALLGEGPWRCKGSSDECSQAWSSPLVTAPLKYFASFALFRYPDRDYMKQYEGKCVLWDEEWAGRLRQMIDWQLSVGFQWRVDIIHSTTTTTASSSHFHA